MIILGYILTGLVAGVASGFFGVGGGIIMIPVMVYFFHLTQHEAQGTSLAVLLLPVGILAAIKYYQEGNVKLTMAVYIAVSFIIGAYFGATLVHYISDPALKRAFGVLLFLVSIKMIIGK